MNRDTIYAPISFEYLLTIMFGKQSYHGFVGEHKVNNWKKHILKLINAIQKSILVNIDTTDEFHKKELLELCNRAAERIKDAETKDEVNLSMIEYVVKIIFELMGKMPNNWDKKVVNHLDYWKLDECRKLTYIQTTKQKANLILLLPNRYPYSERFSNKRELFDKFWDEFKGDSNKFIQWFKEKYKDIYLEIF